jgi:hypothetical protein
MTPPFAARVLAVLLVSTAAACTTGVPSAQPGAPATPATSAEPRGSQPLGAPGCHPASPVTLWYSFLPQVQAGPRHSGVMSVSVVPGDGGGVADAVQ